MRLVTRWSGRTSLLALLALAACGGGGGGGGVPPGPTGGTVSGTVVFTGAGIGDAAVLEAEPNDSADTAHFLGTITAGQTIVVRGHTTSVAGVDPYDGFQLLAPQRVRITATLAFPAGGGNDFDMSVFDLVSLQFVERYLAVTAPEVGVFHAKGAFDLVVEAYAGSGDYTLTIVAQAPSAPIAELEPNGTFPEGQYLGDAVVGDTITVSGTASPAGDAADIVYVGLPAAGRLQGSLAMPPGADFDWTVHDGTADHDAPTQVAAFDTPTSNPETGSHAFTAGSLLAVRVEAFAGSGTWTLTLTIGAPFAPLQKPFATPARAVASKSLEARRPKARDGVPAFGRVTREIVPGEALLGLASGAAGLDAEGALLRAAKPAAGSTEAFQRLELDVPSDLDDEDRARTTLARIAGLRAMPGVAYAEPNRVYHAQLEPNDPFYNLQWHYPLIHLPEAWNITTGSAAVIVAVIDTGRTNHPDLVGNQAGGYDFVSNVGSALDGNGIDPDPTDPGDGGGANGTGTFHGTHVAGTVGATSNDGRGVAGVAWNVRIMHLRVLGDGGSGSTADIAQAIRFAAGLSNSSGTLPAQRAHVINMSLGGPGFDQTLQNAVTAAKAAGTTVIAAAGNENSSGFFSPAGLTGVISVSAVDPQRNKAPYSNFGSAVDVAAPGGNTAVDRNGDGYVDGVLSTLMDDAVSPANPVYRFYQGTSMASPHVAGVAALMLSVNPTLTPDQVETHLKATADDLGTPGRDDTFGSGLVNAYRAVLAAQGGAGGGPLLSIAPTTVNFGAASISEDVLVTNGGGGLLTVGAPTVATDGGGAWLTAALFGAGDATKSATGVRIGVVRGALPVGNYAGRVQVPSNGGTVEVQVLMSVGGAGLPNLDIYVLAIDAATGTTVGQATVNAATGLDFSIPGLPAGTYFVFAGSDVDDDGFICDDGEVCGAWPVEGEPLPVSVVDGGTAGGLVFTVGESLDLESASTGRGIPRR